MGLLTNKTVKRRHSKGNLHSSLETKLNPPILNTLHCSLWSLCSGSSLKVNHLFLFQFFTHHFNYRVSNFIFYAHFSCSPVLVAIFWESWDLTGNYNSTGWLLRKKAWSKNAALDYVLDRDFSIGFDLGWAKHFTPFPWLEPTFLWLDALRNCAMIKKKKAWFLEKQKRKISHHVGWDSLIVLLFIFLQLCCVFWENGTWGEQKASRQS